MSSMGSSSSAQPPLLRPSQAEPDQPPADDLVMVFSIFVHGESGPLAFLPTDPTYEYWKKQTAELTQDGKRQAYELGVYYRKTYGDFLPSEYKREDTYVYSTDTDRSLMSAQCVLTGLYPPVACGEWIENYRYFQPVPIHSNSSRHDNLYPHLSPFDVTIKQGKNVKEEFFEWHQFFYPKKTSNLLDLMLALDNRQAALRKNLLGINFPPNVDHDYFEKKVTKMKLSAFKTYPDFRLVGNHLFRLVLNAITEHTGQSRNPTKMYLYSLHDLNIATLKGVMRLELDPLTTLCGFLTFELHRGPSGRYVIKMKQKLSHDAEVTTVKLSDKNIVEDYISAEEFQMRIAGFAAGRTD